MGLVENSMTGITEYYVTLIALEHWCPMLFTENIKDRWRWPESFISFQQCFSHMLWAMKCQLGLDRILLSVGLEPTAPDQKLGEMITLSIWTTWIGANEIVKLSITHKQITSKSTCKSRLIVTEASLLSGAIKILSTGTDWAKQNVQTQISSPLYPVVPFAATWHNIQVVHFLYWLAVTETWIFRIDQGNR